MKIEFGRSANSLPTAGKLSVSATENERREITAKLEEREGVAAPPPTEPAAITNLTASNINQAVGRADDAVSTITDLRVEQRDLAELAAAQPEVSSTQEAATTRIAEIESEIARVTSAATYNGVSVLTGGTYELLDASRAVNQVVAIGDASALTAPRSDSISTATEAASAYESLSSAISSLRSFSAGTGAARNKAEEIPEVVADAPTIESDITASPSLSEPEAKKLAQEVAQKISSAYGDPDATNDLIEAATTGLDGERVRGLLE